MIIKIIFVLILLTIVPMLVGTSLRTKINSVSELPTIWIEGQITLWAIFEIVAVPLIFKERRFEELSIIYIVLVSIITIISVLFLIYKGKLKNLNIHIFKNLDFEAYIYLGLALLVVLFQIAMAIKLSYNDGDDAFYLAVSTITNNARTMYLKLPYTGGSTTILSRYAMAPFPIWISLISWIANIEPVIVARTILPSVFLLMTYSVYYSFARLLFGSMGMESQKTKKAIFLFLTVIGLLITFGDYSYYSVENFLIARSRQGKAALGNVIIPFTIFVIMLLFSKIKEKNKEYVLLFLCAMAGCLSSTLSIFIISLLIGIMGLLGAICYRQFKLLVLFAICALPCVVCAAMYVIL